MVKSSSSRLTETLTFIRNSRRPTIIPDAMHDRIVELLDVWQNRGASQQTKDRLSALMSQEDATQRAGSKPDRKYVRAATLIQCAIVLPETKWGEYATIMKSTRDEHSKLYDTALQSARDYIGSTPAEINAMLGRLRNDPVATLNSTKFVINGGNKAGNPVKFKIAMKNGAYTFDCYGTNNGRVEISAMNVVATKYKDIKDTPGAINAVQSGDAAGADILLTTQFTGCSFCFMKAPDNQSVRAAHIDPGNTAADPSGTELSETMRSDAGFANGNGGNLKVYGRVPNGSDEFGYPESAGQMTIIGLKDGMNWKIYSQIMNLDGSLVAQRIDA